MRDGPTAWALRLRQRGDRPSGAGARSPGGRRPGPGPGRAGCCSGRVGPAAPGRELSDAEMLRSLHGYEAIEGEPQEWLVGALGPLEALVPDGAGDGLRGYDDVLAPASQCSADELRRSAGLDELRDRDGRPFALGSLPAGYYAEPALRASDKFGTVFTVGKGGGSARSAARHAGPHQKRGRRT